MRPAQVPASNSSARKAAAEKAAGEVVVTEVREWCREEGDFPHGDRCNERAEFLLWGKLFPSEALGPRCYAHAVKHTHWGMPSRPDQWAVLDLRGLTREANR